MFSLAAAFTSCREENKNDAEDAMENAEQTIENAAEETEEAVEDGFEAAGEAIDNAVEETEDRLYIYTKHTELNKLTESVIRNLL